jgi:hypothetical protein
MLDLHDEPGEPFRVTPGFIAFVAAMLLPLVIAIFIYGGAAIVASDVYAARRAEASPSVSAGNDSPDATADVEGWKKSLVGICPLH